GHDLPNRALRRRDGGGDDPGAARGHALRGRERPARARCGSPRVDPGAGLRAGVALARPSRRNGYESGARSPARPRRGHGGRAHDSERRAYKEPLNNWRIVIPGMTYLELSQGNPMTSKDEVLAAMRKEIGQE